MNELDAYTRERDKLRAWVEAEPGHAFGLDVGADDELTSVVARVLPAVRPGDRATACRAEIDDGGALFVDAVEKLSGRPCLEISDEDLFRLKLEKWAKTLG